MIFPATGYYSLILRVWPGYDAIGMFKTVGEKKEISYTCSY